MQSGTSSTGRQRLALVALATLWLSACGGGGGGGTGGGDTSAPGLGASVVASDGGPSPAPAPALQGASTGTPAGAGAPVPPPVPAPAAPTGPTATVQGTDGPDTLETSTHPAVMAGGRGDDIYIVTDPADVVIEQADGGVDEVRTVVGYTLPANVENMSVNYSNLVGGTNELVGNSLDNRITGPAFGETRIFGLDGDDILDAGGRHGAYLDGGAGNDTLINNIGQSRGGPGADTFAVRPRGAHTASDQPMTVLDFTPSEGDRIDGGFLGGGDPAALFASGNLVFDSANQRLIYTLNPAAFQTQPSAVEQIILLPGVTSFDPAWIIRR